VPFSNKAFYNPSIQSDASCRQKVRRYKKDIRSDLGRQRISVTSRDTLALLLLTTGNLQTPTCSTLPQKHKSLTWLMATRQEMREEVEEEKEQV
jgi:hypothetical protein